MGASVQLKHEGVAIRVTTKCTFCGCSHTFDIETKNWVLPAWTHIELENGWMVINDGSGDHIWCGECDLPWLTTKKGPPY